MNNTIGIYCIECLVSHKKIVGSTKRFNNRVAEHYYKLRNNKHGNRHLQNAYNKYGENNIIIYLIEECNEDVLVELEDYWMEQLNTINREFGYNLKKAYRQEITEELREIFRQSNKGKSKPSGWHHTEEAKTKMRKSQLASKFNIKKRKPVSQYDMNWNLINSFNSIIEASTNISISNKKRISNIQSNIQKCCSLKNKQKMAYGYIWEYTLIIDVAT